MSNPRRTTGAAWLHTFTGQALDLLSPQASQIDIVDIAHSLSQMNRFFGHTKRPYSVAEHSVRVCTFLYQQTQDMAVAQLGLMHDAHEYGIGDMAQPVKVAIELLFRELCPDNTGPNPWEVLEERFERAVHARFSLDFSKETRVRWADLRMLMTEAPQMLPWPPPQAWSVPPWAEAIEDIKVEFWQPLEAEVRFLDTFYLFDFADADKRRVAVRSREVAREIEEQKRAQV